MEITSFYPLIPTEDFEATKATYEALGFKVAHTISDPSTEDTKSAVYTIMKNDNGLRVGIITGYKNTKDLPGHSWMNVRDFDAAFELLKAHGYTVFSEVRDLTYTKSVAMRAPEGNILVVVYHKRKDDWE